MKLYISPKITADSRYILTEQDRQKINSRLSRYIILATLLGAVGGFIVGRMG